VRIAVPSLPPDGCPLLCFALSRIVMSATFAADRRKAALRPRRSTRAFPAAVADIAGLGFAGCIKAQPWSLNAVGYPENVEEATSHRPGYKILFCDGHTALVKRSDYLYPPQTAASWNSDHQPHPETWAPKYLWAVQK
jgi:hypothetical protein